MLATWLSVEHPGRDRPEPLAAWVSEPVSGWTGLGVVIVPPVGYEHSSSHRALRTLAEALSRRGCLVIRVDPFGTGDSGGRADEVTDLALWRAAVPAASAWLRRAGATSVVVAGCRVGATLAWLEAEAVGASALVALAPVLSGRRYGREQQLLGEPFPDDIGGDREALGGVAVGGSHFPQPLLDSLSAVDLTTPAAGLPPCLLVAHPGSRGEAKVAEALAASGTPATVTFSPALADFLNRPAEEAVVDPGLIDEIVEWVCAFQPDDGPAGDEPWRPRVDDVTRSASIGWGDTAVVEELVAVGPDELVGVLTRPGVADDGRGRLVVFLNSGSDPHTGPGRAWVDLARGLAARGSSVLRVDFRGWGESPDGPSVPGRPYDPHTLDDTRRLVAALDDEGWTSIVLAGLCAGAWVSLQVARDTAIESVLALNPQMYWQPGDPVEALMSLTRERRLPEIEAIKAEATQGRWDREDTEGLRPPAAAWLDALVARGTPISMIFAEGDDGIEYLRDRLGLRLAAALASGVVRVREIPDIDHGMHRTWLRPRMIDALADELERLPG